MRWLGKIILSIVYVFAISCPVFAGVADKVEGWFDGMNYSNITAPGVYEGQSARYGTLGGISARAPITQPFKFVSIQTPKFSAGCGGIDFYAGGFSAINADQFTENLRAIGQNAQSLLFMLAIQVVSPQLSGAMEDIQDWANKYLNMNMDSCEAASKMVGGALQYFDEEKANCITTRQNDYGEDFSTASFACTTGGARKKTKGRDNDKNQLDFIKGNLAWYVLMQDPFFRADPEFAQLVMNIIGTMIITDDGRSSDSPVKFRVIEPAIKDKIEKERFNNIYNALLYGKASISKLRIYKCRDLRAVKDACVDIEDKLTETTPSWAGLYSKINELVDSIANKIESDAKLTTMELGLVASTEIPIYRFISASTTYFPRGTSISKLAKEYTSLIAHDILLRSLSAVIEKVEQLTSNMNNGMAEAKRIVAFRGDLETVLSGLSNKRQDNEYKAQQHLQMQEQIYLYERELLPKLGGEIVTAAMWGNE